MYRSRRERGERLQARASRASSPSRRRSPSPTKTAARSATAASTSRSSSAATRSRTSGGCSSTSDSSRLPHAEKIELQDPSGSRPGRSAGRPRDARAEVGTRQARRHHAGAGARRPRRGCQRRVALDRRAGGARRSSRRCRTPEVAKGENAAAQFLIRWRGEADPRAVKALDTYWISAAEHGLNASTFTARIAASTGADCAAAHVVGGRDAVRPAARRRAGARAADARRGRRVGRPRGLREGDRSTAASGSWASATASIAPRTRARACSSARRRSSARRGSRWRRRSSRRRWPRCGRSRPDRPLETNVEYWAAVVLDIAEIPPRAHAGDVRLRSRRRLVGAHPRAEAHRPADPAVGALRRPRPAADRRTDVMISLAEAAAQADALAEEGNERELSQLRAEWDEELEAAARSERLPRARGRVPRDRAVPLPAEDRAASARPRRPSPAVRGSALLSLEACRATIPASSTTCARCCTSW